MSEGVTIDSRDPRWEYVSPSGSTCRYDSKGVLPSCGWIPDGDLTISVSLPGSSAILRFNGTSISYLTPLSIPVSVSIPDTFGSLPLAPLEVQVDGRTIGASCQGDGALFETSGLDQNKEHVLEVKWDSSSESRAPCLNSPTSPPRPPTVTTTTTTTKSVSVTTPLPHKSKSDSHEHSSPKSSSSSGHFSSSHRNSSAATSSDSFSFSHFSDSRSVSFSHKVTTSTRPVAASSESHPSSTFLSPSRTSPSSILSTSNSSSSTSSSSASSRSSTTHHSSFTPPPRSGTPYRTKSSSSLSPDPSSLSSSSSSSIHPRPRRRSRLRDLKQLGDPLLGGVESVVGGLASHVESAVGGLASHVESAVGGLASHVESAVGGLVSHVESAVGSIASHVESDVGEIVSTVQSAVHGVESSVGSIIGGLGTSPPPAPDAPLAIAINKVVINGPPISSGSHRTSIPAPSPSIITSTTTLTIPFTQTIPTVISGHSTTVVVTKTSEIVDISIGPPPQSSLSISPDGVRTSPSSSLSSTHSSSSSSLSSSSSSSSSTSSISSSPILSPSMPPTSTRSPSFSSSPSISSPSTTSPNADDDTGNARIVGGATAGVIIGVGLILLFGFCLVKRKLRRAAPVGGSFPSGSGPGSMRSQFENVMVRLGSGVPGMSQTTLQYASHESLPDSTGEAEGGTGTGTGTIPTRSIRARSTRSIFNLPLRLSGNSIGFHPINSTSSVDLPGGVAMAEAGTLPVSVRRSGTISDSQAGVAVRRDSLPDPGQGFATPGPLSGPMRSRFDPRGGSQLSYIPVDVHPDEENSWYDPDVSNVATISGTPTSSNAPGSAVMGADKDTAGRIRIQTLAQRRSLSSGMSFVTPSSAITADSFQSNIATAGSTTSLPGPRPHGNVIGLPDRPSRSIRPLPANPASGGDPNTTSTLTTVSAIRPLPQIGIRDTVLQPFMKLEDIPRGSILGSVLNPGNPLQQPLGADSVFFPLPYNQTIQGSSSQQSAGPVPFSFPPPPSRRNSSSKSRKSVIRSSNGSNMKNQLGLDIVSLPDDLRDIVKVYASGPDTWEDSFKRFRKNSNTSRPSLASSTGSKVDPLTSDLASIPKLIEGLEEWSAEDEVIAAMNAVRDGFNEDTPDRNFGFDDDEVPESDSELDPNEARFDHGVDSDTEMLLLDPPIASSGVSSAEDGRAPVQLRGIVARKGAVTGTDDAHLGEGGSGGGAVLRGRSQKASVGIRNILTDFGNPSSQLGSRGNSGSGGSKKSTNSTSRSGGNRSSGNGGLRASLLQQLAQRRSRTQSVASESGSGPASAQTQTTPTSSNSAGSDVIPGPSSFGKQTSKTTRPRSAGGLPRKRVKSTSLIPRRPSRSSVRRGTTAEEQTRQDSNNSSRLSASTWSSARNNYPSPVEAEELPAELLYGVEEESVSAGIGDSRAQSVISLSHFPAVPWNPDTPWTDKPVPALSSRGALAGLTRRSQETDTKSGSPVAGEAVSSSPESKKITRQGRGLSLPVIRALNIRRPSSRSKSRERELFTRSPSPISVPPVPALPVSTSFNLSNSKLPKAPSNPSSGSDNGGITGWAKRGLGIGAKTMRSGGGSRAELQHKRSLSGPARVSQPQNVTQSESKGQNRRSVNLSRPLVAPSGPRAPAPSPLVVSNLEPHDQGSAVTSGAILPTAIVVDSPSTASETSARSLDRALATVSGTTGLRSEIRERKPSNASISTSVSTFESANVGTNETQGSKPGVGLGSIPMVTAIGNPPVLLSVPRVTQFISSGRGHGRGASGSGSSVSGTSGLSGSGMSTPGSPGSTLLTIPSSGQSGIGVERSGSVSSGSMMSKEGEAMNIGTNETTGKYMTDAVTNIPNIPPRVGMTSASVLRKLTLSPIPDSRPPTTTSVYSVTSTAEEGLGLERMDFPLPP